MAPRVKVTKESIIETAIDLIRRENVGAINARSIAASLGCSTQPIFSNFTSMEELQSAVIAEAYSLYLDFIKAEIESEKHPPYKSMGMAYIRFAREERELFKLLFMRDRTGEDLSPSPDFKKSVEIIMQANGLSYEKASLLHLEMWSCVHGIATMMATSFLSLDWELISNMLSDVYLGARAGLLSEENK